MKKLTYYCPTCKKDITITSDKPIIPSANICIECRGQVWLRGISEIEDTTKAKE